MTLTRQLAVLLAALVGLLFLGTLAIGVHNARDYLEAQLASHAQDAANSLGLSATAQAAQADRGTLVAMVDAMFHRGDYLSIRFEDLDGETWIERASQFRVPEVPAWFLGLFRLDPPERAAILMSGWRQVGRVWVKSHPGLAYRQLWRSAQQMMALFLGASLLALLAGVVGLRVLLRPLKSVERQAHAICEREFPVVETRPFTLEFRRVVEAMNRLSSRIARMLGDAERVAAQLRRDAFQDPVTGLANRRQFMDVLEHRVADPELFRRGGLLLLQVADFKGYNQRRGYPAGDRLLAEVAHAVAGCLDDVTAHTLARLSGADFAVLCEGDDEARLQRLAERIVGAVAGLYGRLDLTSADVAHAGVAVVGGQSARQLLAEADMALREAQRAGANAWVVRRRADPAEQVRGGSDWRGLIERAIAQQDFRLSEQAVLRCSDGEVHHHELFLRIPDPAGSREELAAAVFMPMAESTGLASAIDRAVAGRVVRALEDGSYPGRVAMNLNAASLVDDGLLTWLAGRLQRAGDVGFRLILELPEYSICGHVDRLIRWNERLGPLGVTVSLDHFGKGFASFAYLRAVKAHFLKIDGSLVRHLDRHDDNRFLVRSIAEIAHGLGMEVIAESVESEAVWRTVRSLGLDAGRGRWLGEPR